MNKDWNDTVTVIRIEHAHNNSADLQLVYASTVVSSKNNICLFYTS